MSKALHIDRAVDGNLKPVKDIDGTVTALELSTDNVRVKNLEVLGSIANNYQKYAINDHHFFDAENSSRTYFKDVDSSTYPHKWLGYDTEDSTTIGDTISLAAPNAATGLIVPFDCNLVGVRWVGYQSQNYDQVVYLQTWTSEGAEDNTVNAVDLTLRDTITLTNYKRKYYNQYSKLNVSLGAGNMIYPAFQYVSGTRVQYQGQVSFLIEGV
jgi:hypothetical protein